YYRATYMDGESYSFGEVQNPAITGLQEGRQSNENVTWEMATKYNIGFESRWLNSRLSLNADLFKEHRTNILTNPGLFLIAAGMNSLPPQNIGIVDNKGLELELGWDDQAGANVGYFVKGQFSYAKNTVREMSEPNQPFDYLYGTGHSIKQFMGYRFDGFFSSYEEIAASPQQFGLSNVTPGDIKYKDLNQDGIIDQN